MSRRALVCTDTGWSTIGIIRGSALNTITAESVVVDKITISANEEFVLATVIPEGLMLWNVDTGERIAAFTGEGMLLAPSISADGKLVLAGEADGRLHFLRLEGCAIT